MWGTNGLGSHPSLRHGVGGPGTAGADEYLAAENRILKAQLLTGGSAAALEAALGHGDETLH